MFQEEAERGGGGIKPGGSLITVEVGQGAPGRGHLLPSYTHPTSPGQLSWHQPALSEPSPEAKK